MAVKFPELCLRPGSIRSCWGHTKGEEPKTSDNYNKYRYFYKPQKETTYTKGQGKSVRAAIEITKHDTGSLYA